MFAITRKGLSYFVSSSGKGISFAVSTSKRLYITNFGTPCISEHVCYYYKVIYLKENPSFTHKNKIFFHCDTFVHYFMYNILNLLWLKNLKNM